MPLAEIGVILSISLTFHVKCVTYYIFNDAQGRIFNGFIINAVQSHRRKSIACVKSSRFISRMEGKAGEGFLNFASGPLRPGYSARADCGIPAGLSAFLIQQRQGQARRHKYDRMWTEQSLTPSTSQLEYQHGLLLHERPGRCSRKRTKAAAVDSVARCGFCCGVTANSPTGSQLPLSSYSAGSIAR